MEEGGSSGTVFNADVHYCVTDCAYGSYGYIVFLLKNQKKDRDANSKGTMLLLRVQLIEYHAEWKARGYVTKHGLQNFLEMYDAYHALGGNGMVTELLNEVKELPIKG